ncbi:MAG: amidohydrolase, partial [Spirochaetales bacterium]|nr:amidohydrolase [Spirochaetales bacterium]
MNIGVQFLREHMPSTARIHYAITDTGGISPNIVQAHASALYQIRAPFAPELASLYERVNNIAKGAALMTDTQVEIKFLKGTSNTLLIPALDEIMYKNMCEIPNPVEKASDLDFAMEIVKTQKDPATIGDSAFNIKPYPWNKAGNMPLPGSSDVGDVSWICPVTQCGTSTWPKGTAAHSWQAVACGKSDFAHRGMLYAGEIIASTAVDIYENPEVLETAWKELREKTGNQPYNCPIPPEISPSELEAETT